MNKRYFICLLALWMGCFTLWGRGSHVVTTSSRYTFSFEESAAQLNGKASEGYLRPDNRFEKGFCLRFNVDFQPGFPESEILSIDNVLSVCLRWQDPAKNDAQNYVAFPMQDGSVPVMEATLQLKDIDDSGSSGRIRVGVPLSLLDRPWGSHQVVLNYTDIALTLYVDGILYDNDFVVGHPSADSFTHWKRDVRFVSNASLDYSVSVSSKVRKNSRKHRPELQYFTPEGHNAWMGDVATCWFGGRYHIFYLYDRRGHRSKMGRGGHYFAHLSTDDFKTWTEHEPAVPLEYKWQTLGTGTPFVYRDSLYLSYGLHTTRISANARKTLDAQWKQIEEEGHTRPLHMDTLQTLPAGSTYAVCTDGVSEFRKSGILFHPCENPSISTLPNGKLVMFASYGARGTWIADRPEGPWKCVDKDFPLGGDCTFPFTWGEYEYVIGGFTQMWRKTAHGNEDLAALGQDIYDGLSVPCVTEVMDGRRIMAGWVQVNGHWGGALVVRELLQGPGGRLESCWMPELMPVTGRKRELAYQTVKEEAFETEHSSFLLTFDVVGINESSKVMLELASRRPSPPSTWWTMDFASGRAQFSGSSSSKEKTIREGGKPHHAQNYAIEGIARDEERCPVRIIVKQSNKLCGSLVDVEIGGRRTMISYRGGLDAGLIRLIPENATVENVCLSSLEK